MPRSHSANGPRRPRPLRTGAVLVAGLMLLGAAYQAAFARAPGSWIGPLGSRPDYGQDQGDEGGGLSSGAAVGIGVGGAVLVYAALRAVGVFEGGDGAAAPGDEDDCRERYPAMPASLTAVRVRLAPERQEFRPGETRCFRLEGRAGDGNWYSLTSHPSATIVLGPGTEGLVKVDGSRNKFLLPLGAPAGLDGRSFPVTASVTLGGTLHTASASARVRIR